METFTRFIKEKTGLALLIVFILGILSGFFIVRLISVSNSGRPSLAVLSPKPEEGLSGIVPVRVYYKTKENDFLLSADYRIDESLPRNLPVTRINDQEVAIVGAWDSTVDPGKHQMTISLYKTLKNGKKTLIAQTKVPVSVLLFQ